MREGGNEREGEKANKYVDNAVPVSQSVKLGLSLHSVRPSGRDGKGSGEASK